MKPLVAIAGNLAQLNGWEIVNTTMQGINAIAKAGGIPFIIPMIKDNDSIYTLLDHASALFLPGGSDVQPLLYGKPPHPMLTSVQPNLDLFQIEIIRIAVKKKMPIFGVCRGIQILNVAMGGTLIQHIPEEKPFIQHLASTHKRWNIHWINALPGSRLARLFGERFQANSYHHQAPDEIAPQLIATGWADDGVIECLEHRHLPFAITVQWHPECMLLEDDAMWPLFTEFINAAHDYKDGSFTT